jgi:hypothetical protein
MLKAASQSEGKRRRFNTTNSPSISIESVDTHQVASCPFREHCTGENAGSHWMRDLLGGTEALLGPQNCLGGGVQAPKLLDYRIRRAFLTPVQHTCEADIHRGSQHHDLNLPEISCSG